MSDSVPLGWECKSLIECSSNGISNGVFCDPKNLGSGYKLINVYEMYQGYGVDISLTKRLRLTDKEFLNNKVKYGDIFFTRSSLKMEGIAYCNINLSHDADITYDGHLMKITPNLEVVNAEYLARFCLSDFARTYFMSAAKHSTMTTIAQSDIAPLPVLLPPLPEQQKIAKILTSVDEVIEKTQAQIDKLRDLKTGMMQELLTHGIGHTEFKDSPVGRIPAEWEVVKFKEIFSDYKYGPRFSSKDYHEQGNVKTIRGTDLSRIGEISYQNVPIAKLDEEIVNLHALRDGDLVMITTADCGATAIFREQSIPFIASAYAIKLTPKDNVDSHFVTHFMQTSSAKKQVESFIRKGTVANLPGSDVMSITLALPPIKEQQYITEVLNHLDEKISLKQNKLVSIVNTKKALMQDLLTGKVRVKVDSE